MEFNQKITINDIETNVSIPHEYNLIVQHLTQEFSYDSLNSPVSCKDLIKATLRAHAALNKRNTVCIDDLVFVKRIQPFLTNVFSPYEGRIVRLRAQRLSLRQICQEIGKGNYQQQVQRVITKAELRGILSPQNSQPEKEEAYYEHRDVP
jgi:hypothetical protein